MSAAAPESKGADVTTSENMSGGGTGGVGDAAGAAAAPLARQIDGKATAAKVRAELKDAVAALVAKHGAGATPGLAVVLVGERPDSAMYVRMKRRACDEVGIASVQRTLPADASQGEIEASVRALNDDPAVHGVLVQLPLPRGVDEAAVLDCVDVAKDVDGLHPANVGALALRGREPRYVACTPLGVMELLDRYGVELAGKRAVVLGRSNIVGVPVAALLQQRDATVTVCHSRTRDVAAIVREADVVVAAVGQAEMVRGAWLKPGCVVVDVGINDVPDATKKRGARLVGDVCFDEAERVASLITPVPGGVGPMTIAMLMRNTVLAATRAAEAAAAAGGADGAGAGAASGSGGAGGGGKGAE
mmetsp:Transcript_12300/g.43128  ORF Transcript_12300/g.43128 Transcript_12300/m.43128 type:complete len:361 (-) Transcript_12300:7-1089(-)